MDKGFYVIFEGPDGAGKTTAMRKVAESLSHRLSEQGITHDPIVLTHHPGSTPLGKHIRKLIKFPHKFDEDIVIDDLSRQMFYMIDTVSFVKTLLEPSLMENKIVLADRSSYISAIAYGRADGLDLRDVEKLFDILTPPKADKLVILQLPAKVCMERIRESREEEGDHYDQQPSDFFERVVDLYDNLVTSEPEQTALVSRSVSINDVSYVDATLPSHQIVDIITENLVKTLIQRCVLSSSE